MTLKKWWKTAEQADRMELAEKAGTSVNNLRNIAYGQSCSPSMAESIAKASGGDISELELLYPERYE